MKTPHALRAALVPLLVMSVGCARTADSASDGSDFTFPDDNAVVLRVEYIGGFVPPAHLATRLPMITVYADGRVLTEGPRIEPYPPPALPNIQLQHISRDDAQKLIDRALAAGVGSSTDLGQPPVVDASSTRITVSTANGTKTTEAYALAEVTTTAGLTPAQQAARKKLSDLVQALTDLPATLGASTVSEAEQYVPTAVAGVASPWVSPGDAGGANSPEIAWPGPALPGRTLGGLADLSCVVAQDQTAAMVIEAAGTATSITPWTSGGERWTVGVRPLLPDESDCDDLME